MPKPGTRRGPLLTPVGVQDGDKRAEEVLLDQIEFIVTPDVYAEFLARLDAPPQPNGKLKRMMNAKAPWDAA